jgi:hypothetical protein
MLNVVKHLFADKEPTCIVAIRSSFAIAQDDKTPQ